MADRRTLSLGGAGSSEAGWSLDSQGLRQTRTHWDEGEAFSLLFLDRQFCFHSVIFCPNFPIYGKASSVPALLPGDPPVFKNKWCGLSGDPSVALVPGIRCRPTSWMWGREAAQRWGVPGSPQCPPPQQNQSGAEEGRPQNVDAQSSCAEQGTPKCGGSATLQRSPSGQPACVGVGSSSLPPSFFMCLFFYY